MDLAIRDIKASIEDKEILQGLSLTIKPGEIHALMGPNGSGKSTLANVLMGHPRYQVSAGSIKLGDRELLDLPVDERSRLGLYLAFQYPVEVPGITVGKFLKRACELRTEGDFSTTAYIKDLRAAMDQMGIDQQFINRYLNEGFSGGEKKRMEILQMLMLRPRYAILDETDSGLDIDALQVVARGVNTLRGPGFGALIITHYQRILDHVKPDYVHIMYKGKIITSGGPTLVQELEARGYGWIRDEFDAQEAV